MDTPDYKQENPKEETAPIVEENLRSVKMRTMPVGKLLFAMSMPAILSMLVQALYNVVDSIFISYYSQKGIDALSIAFPMQTLIIAFAVGIGVGANAQIAKKLGERKNEEASCTARNALFLTFCTVVLFIVLGLTVSRPFIAAYSADAETVEMGVAYLTIVMSVSFGAFIEITLSKILQATGNMIVPMISQLLGAIINIILDPILIFVCHMGVTGAAVATVIGQIVSMCFVILIFIFKKQDVSLDFRRFKPQWQYIRGILIIGIPTMVMNAVSAFTTMLMNAIVKPLSEYAIRILGIYFKLQSFVFMPVFGLTQGALPILSYNYGSRDPKRYKRASGLTVAVALGIMLLGLLLFQAGAPLLMKIFNADGDYLTQGAYALRIISIAFPFAAFGITVTTIFQSLGCGITSLIMSLLRQVALLLPLAFVLAITTGLAGVWFCYPISEFVVFAIFTPLMLGTVKKRFAVQTVREENHAA